MPVRDEPGRAHPERARAQVPHEEEQQQPQAEAARGDLGLPVRLPVEHDLDQLEAEHGADQGVQALVGHRVEVTRHRHEERDQHDGQRDQADGGGRAAVQRGHRRRPGRPGGG